MRNTSRPMNLSICSELSVSSTTSSLSSIPLSPRRALLGVLPPPSPSLPSLVPRHGKKNPTVAYRSWRILLLACGAFATLILLGTSFLTSAKIQGPLSVSSDYEIVSDDALPKHPSAVIVRDRRGKIRWTVSIPPQHPFPLRPAEYQELCQQADHIGRELDMGGSDRRLDYYAKDPNFMDVGDAVRMGLLPRVDEHSLNQGFVGSSGADGVDQVEDQKVCKRSLTYVMETEDAGMGNTLLGLWMAYGLAQKEGRAFFIDDTRWPYGNYTTYFQPPPLPLCISAPPTQRLPCPNAAAHLVVSSATFPWTFGAAFDAEFADAHKPPKKAQRRVFALLRAGYEALFHFRNADDERYVVERAALMFSKAHDAGGMNVGLHVRRGDAHPWEYEFARDYLPLTRYTDEAQQVLIDAYDYDDVAGRVGSSAERLTHRHGIPGFSASQLFLASDDPEVYTAPEMSRAQRAQDSIVLASKSVLEQEARKQSSNGGSQRSAWIDSIHGWEGGFYHDQFFGLGISEPGTAPPPRPAYGQSHSYAHSSDRDVDAHAVSLPREVSESALALRGLVAARICSIWPCWRAPTLSFVRSLRLRAGSWRL